MKFFLGLFRKYPSVLLFSSYDLSSIFAYEIQKLFSPVNTPPATCISLQIGFMCNLSKGSKEILLKMVLPIKISKVVYLA